MGIETTEVTQAIWKTSKRLENGVDVLTAKGKNYAAMERDYRKKLAIEIMKLRDAKIPVSIIADVARGNIADDLFKRDLAETEYKSCREMLNALGIELSGLQSILKVQSNIGEWLNNGIKQINRRSSYKCS